MESKCYGTNKTTEKNILNEETWEWQKKNVKLKKKSRKKGSKATTAMPTTATIERRWKGKKKENRMERSESLCVIGKKNKTREKKKDLVIVETLKLPLRFVDPNQDWHTNDSFGNNFYKGFRFLNVFSFIFLALRCEVNERICFSLARPVHVCVCVWERTKASENASEERKKCAVRKDKNRTTRSEMNTPFMYVYKSISAFQNMLRKLLIKSLAKEQQQHRARPTIDAENLASLRGSCVYGVFFSSPSFSLSSTSSFFWSLPRL